MCWREEEWLKKFWGGNPENLLLKNLFFESRHINKAIKLFPLAAVVVKSAEIISGRANKKPKKEGSALLCESTLHPFAGHWHNDMLFVCDFSSSLGPFIDFRQHKLRLLLVCETTCGRDNLWMDRFQSQSSAFINELSFTHAHLTWTEHSVIEIFVCWFIQIMIRILPSTSISLKRLFRIFSQGWVTTSRDVRGFLF